MRETACTEMREALAERARGTSPANAALDRHLAQCPGCRASLAALEQVLALRQRLRTELTADAESAGLDRLRPAIAREAQRARRRTGESSRRWLGWFALAPLAATAAFALFLAWPSTDDATVVRAIRTRGEVLIREPAGEVASLDEVARALRAGTRLETAVESGVTLTAARHTVHLEPSSVLFVLTVSRQGVELALERGRLTAHSVPGGGPQALQIGVPQGVVQGEGTRFELSAASTRSLVAVTEGRVLVLTRAGSRHRLQAGQTLGRAGAPGPASDLDAPGPRADGVDAEPEPATPDARTTEPGEVERATTGPEARPRASKPSARAVAPVLPTAPPVTPTAPVASPANEDGVSRIATLTRRGDCVAAEKLVEEMQASLNDTRRSRALASVAECFYAADRLEEALRLYQSLAARHPQTPAGENAAYELGRLLRKLGHPARAAEGFAAYLERYPRGVLASEARFWRCQALFEQGEADDSLACLRQLRETEPTSPRLSDTYLLEATLFRVSKSDCRQAVERYSRYLSNPGPYSEQASSWKRWCEQRLGAQRPSEP